MYLHSLCITVISLTVFQKLFQGINKYQPKPYINFEKIYFHCLPFFFFPATYFGHSNLILSTIPDFTVFTFLIEQHSSLLPSHYITDIQQMTVVRISIIKLLFTFGSFHAFLCKRKCLYWWEVEYRMHTHTPTLDDSVSAPDAIQNSIDHTKVFLTNYFQNK